jgi:hypothetical protein
MIGLSIKFQMSWLKEDISSVRILNNKYDPSKYKLLIEKLQNQIKDYNKTKPTKPISDRYIFFIQTIHKSNEKFISEVWMFDYIENHAMRDSTWDIPFNEKNKQLLLDLYLNLMNCENVTIPIGVNNWDIRVAKTLGIFPPFPDELEEGKKRKRIPSRKGSLNPAEKKRIKQQI